MKIFKAAQKGKLQPSLFFDSWAEGNDIKDEYDYTKPLYHGTFYDFDHFDLSKGNPDNFFGKEWIYTSDDPDDASTNYSSEESPDFTNKIELYKESLESDLDYWEELGIDPDDEAATKQHLDEKSRALFPKDRGRIIPLYGKMSNPVVLDLYNPTTYYVDFAEDDEEDFESAVLTKIGEAYTEALYDFTGNDERIQELTGDFMNHFWGDEYITATEIVSFIADQGIYDDETGLPCSRAVAGQFFVNMGHDGIIIDAHKEFPKMTNPGVKHYLFSDPKQLKSAIGNDGVYDPKTSILTAKRKSIFFKRNP